MAKKEHSAPKLQSLLIISDDAKLAAQMSSIYARNGQYVPVVDCPRLARHDADNEIIRRTNIAARYQPDSILLAAPSNPVRRAFEDHLPEMRLDCVYSIDDLKKIKIPPVSRPKSKLEWGKQDIGLGLLKALRNGQEIIFTDKTIERLPICPELDHLVVCEDGDEFSQIIAANYAYSIGAGMCIIPEVSEEDSDAICETFYNCTAQGYSNQTERLEDIKNHLINLSSEIPLEEKRLITFITRKVPWGYAYPEVPTTHIFSYPDMGISILNAIVAEQPNSEGIALGVMIDPEQVEASEVDRVKDNLAPRGVLLKTLKGPGANVYDVSRHIALLPYDFLLISTHCGDSDGWRWTYKYTDSEGLDRILVTNIAIGIGHIPDEDEMLEVQTHVRIESLDGVAWNDPKAKESLYVGTAILDYIERSADFDKFAPVKKEKIDRVPGSSALSMWGGHNYILTPEQIAGEQLPIIINNACLSWHRLASTFTFAHARAYIGTLFEVLDSQAHEVAVRLTGRYFGKSLAVALWRAQNDVYGSSLKRPYILVGPHFQRLRTTKGDKAKIVFERMERAHFNLLRYLKKDSKTDYATKKTKENIAFLKNQMESVLNLIKRRY